MTPEIRDRWARAKEETERELPELRALGEHMREAAAEDTLSGHLRRAIHRSAHELADTATAAGISTSELNEFLAGERTLRSDVLDRLAAAVDFPQTISQPAAADNA